MDAQLIRYLDGELPESESMAFLQRLETEPALRRALEEEERLLDAAHRLAESKVPEGFADRVMDALPQSLPSAPSRLTTPRRRPNWSRWAPALSAAALVVLAFALGRLSLPAQPDSNTDLLPIASGTPVLRPDFSAIDASAGGGYRIVHLVYAPDDNSPARVAVAGSFNGWNSGEIPMRREGESWTATLILPPGRYEYMFIEDDARWVTDPDAARTRDDGFGGRNAVLDVDA